ncbi:MAG: lysine--tRNA ligase, partial [Gemmatimonadetes bacterium]
MSEELNQVERVRREKLEALQERGLEPYAYNYPRTHASADARVLFEQAEAADDLDENGHGAVVGVAGRIVSYRSHGKSAFAHLEDGAGRIQVYFRRNVLGEEAYEALELADLGDWVGVTGPLFRTRTGEVTVQADSWAMLAKSLRP